MRLSPSPDLSSDRRLAWTTLAVTAVVVAMLCASAHGIGGRFGDTDDAMRMVLVRDLLHGRGWYDQLVTRLQPPHGVYLHWSRLLDGALAGLIATFSLVMPAPAAETAVRFAWPLLWIAPAVGCALLIARRVGGAAAVLVCAVLLAANVQLFYQFVPGRVDHHDIQIVMALAAAACALARRRRTELAALAGAATALGLAIGMEALVFEALVGASFALSAVLSEDGRRPGRAYGLSLAGASLALFLVQTPPWRWSLSACDALAFNLVGALVIAGLGLAALGVLPKTVSRNLRLCLLAAVGAGALGVYLGLDPACIHGPLGAVDPRVGPFWFSTIRELMPWWELLRLFPQIGLQLVLICAFAAAAAVWVGLRLRRARDWSGLLAVALCLAGVAEASLALRAETYALWFGAPLIAAAVAELGRRFWNNALIPDLVAAAAASPVYLAMLLSLALPAGGASGARAAAASAADMSRCFDNAAYGELAGLPAGVVLADPDLGPFALANTPHSVLSAPYHRMTWGIFSAHQALAAAPGADEPAVRALGVTYVVDCSAQPVLEPAQSLTARLHRGAAPAWLEPVSSPSAMLRIWRVRAG